MKGACAVLYCHLWSVWPYHIFPYYLITARFFWKRLLNIKCVFWCSIQLLFEKNSFQEESSKIWSQKYISVHVKYPLFLWQFNETWIFSTDYWKSLKYNTSRNSVQWETSCSMRMDGQTDMTKLIVAFFFINLGFVGPCIFTHSNELTN